MEGLDFEVVVGYEQAESALKNVTDMFKEMMEQAQASGEGIDESMQEVVDALEGSMKDLGENSEYYLEQFKAVLASIKEQMENMEDGEAKQSLQNLADGFESVIAEIENTIAANGELDESFNSVHDVMVKLLGGTENYDKIMNGLPPQIRQTITSIQGMTSAAKAFIATPLGITLAAIVAALTAMRTWLNSSVEGQLKMAEATGYLQGILGQLKEIVIAVGKALYKAFTDPKQAIKDFARAIKDNIANRIKAVGDMAAAVGKILKSAFTFDFDGVKDAAKELGESFLQFTSGIDNLPGKLADSVRTMKSAAEENAKINREAKELEIERSEWAKKRTELETQMVKAQGNMWAGTQAQRKKAMEEYKAINEEIYQNEVKLADKEVELQKRRNALTTNSIEDENALREAERKRLEVDREREQRLASIKRRENSINNMGSGDVAQQAKIEKKLDEDLSKFKQRNRAAEIELMKEGYAKQIEAAKAAYDFEIEEIKRTAKTWKDENKKKGTLTAEQEGVLAKANELAAQKMQKANEDALKKMIEDFKSYDQKRTDLEQAYANIVGTIRAEAYKTDDQGNFIHNEQEILAYEQAIAKAMQDEADALLSIEEEYGKINKLSKEKSRLETQRDLAASIGDVDEVKRLNEEIYKIKKTLADIQKAANTKSIKQIFKEWFDDLKASDFIEAGSEIANVISDIGKAAENEALANFGSMLSHAGNIGAKIASGDYLGAALTLITDIGSAIADDIAKINEFEKANRQVVIEANKLNIDNLLGGENGVFGDNAVQQLANYLKAINLASQGLAKLGNSRAFTVLDRNAFVNAFGGNDQFMKLDEFAEKSGMALLDEYGNINVQLLQLFENTYEDLTEADKQWIDNAIDYANQYKEAMDGIVSYLNSLFGDMAGTLADQLVDSFLEGGKAAMDFGAVTSDVAKQMAKDFIKNMLLTEVFDKYADRFKAVMTSDASMEDKQQMLLGYFSVMQAEAEQLQPAIQAYLQAMSQFFGASEEMNDAVMSGNLLQSASQDSVDLLNGQLNAIRVNQSMATNRINDVLLQLSGIHTDMNNGLGQSVRHLESIDRNTSSGGSILTQLGIWLG